LPGVLRIYEKTRRPPLIIIEIVLSYSSATRLFVDKTRY